MTALNYVTSAAKGGLGLVLLTASGHAQSRTELTMTQLETVPLSVAEDRAIRPFRVNVSDKALADLRRRILATRWPEKETVADESQGVPLATVRELAGYWATDYDWRKGEAKLKALPQFTTTIDGMTTSNASSAFPPYLTGSVSGPMSLVCSSTEPGQPWLMISGSAFFSRDRTWMK